MLRIADAAQAVAGPVTLTREEAEQIQHIMEDPNASRVKLRAALRKLWTTYADVIRLGLVLDDQADRIDGSPKENGPASE